MDSLPNAVKIVKKLVAHGYIAYLAGGWVRDFLMGHPSDDIDIATNATPPQIMDLFPNTVLVGLTFGVVIVVIEGHAYEVATFRKDLAYEDGRRPAEIEFASNPQEDAERRDFTINGMFYDPLEEKVLDFVGGKLDIERGMIRAIGDPHERFFEDRLRMLRAFRFAARFRFSIEAETQEAIKENVDKFFPSVAMERVWQEFNKMVAFPGFEHAIVEMHRLLLLDVIFPEVKGVHLNDLKHIVESYTFFPKETPTILYVMLLFIDLSIEQQIVIAKRLRISNQDVKLVEYLHQLYQALKDPTLDSYQWAYLMAHPHYELCLRVLAAKEKEKGEFLLKEMDVRQKKLHFHIERVAKGKTLVTADHLKQYGIKPGKSMGELIKKGEMMAINEDIKDSQTILGRLFP